MKTQEIAKMTMTEIVSIYNDKTGKNTKNPFKSKPAAIEAFTKLGFIDDEKIDKRCTWNQDLVRDQKEHIKALRKTSLKGQLAKHANGTRTIDELAEIFDWSPKYVKFQLRNLNRNKGYGFHVWPDQKVIVFPEPVFA